MPRSGHGNTKSEPGAVGAGVVRAGAVGAGAEGVVMVHGAVRIDACTVQ